MDCHTGGNVCAPAATSTCTSDCQEIGTCVVNGYVYTDTDNDDEYTSGTDTPQANVIVDIN